MARSKSKKSLTASANSGAPEQKVSASLNKTDSDGSSPGVGLTVLHNGSNGSAHHDTVNGNGNHHFLPELAEKLKELVRLAQDQGYVTYSDIRETLSSNTVNHAELDD